MNKTNEYYEYSDPAESGPENEVRDSGYAVVQSFHDLDVYQSSYACMLKVFREVLPLLPPEEKFDLTDQLRRSSKAVPRLIAEGFAKRHQAKGFQKYLDDARGESNETYVSLAQARDLYIIAVDETLIDAYDKISRQLFNLALSWDRHNERKRTAR